MWKMMFCTLIIGVLTAQLVWDNKSGAQEQTAHPDSTTNTEPVESSWLSNGKELGTWWDKNPKTLPSLPEALLYHLEGSYSLTKNTGVVELDSRSLNLQLYLRKGLTTSETSYSLAKNKMEIKLQNGFGETEEYYYHQGLYHAITDKISLTVGTIGDRNLSKFIDKRTVHYGGLIYTPFDTEDLTLSFIGAYGQTKITYLMSEIPWPYIEDFPSMEAYKSGAMYFLESLNWQISPSVGLSQKIRHLGYFDDPEFYNTEISLEINTTLTESISLITGYTLEIDKNSFTKTMIDYLAARRASGKDSGSMETKATSINVGLQFSF